MESYSFLAGAYDELTEDVRYERWADYLEKLFRSAQCPVHTVLDLACGTGSLTLALHRLGFDVYGVDGSAAMLSEAKDKAYDQEADVLFLCQKMQRLDLYGTVDTVFCALDSINHLSGPEQVLETFKRVAFFLNDDGWFIFDVNTPFKHEKVLADNTFVYDLPDIYCVWQNTYNPQDGSVAIELDFFERQGKLYARSSERFSERAYSAEKLTALLREAGFDRVEVFGDMRFDAPAPDEQRMIFAAHITNSQNGVFAG